MVPEPPGRSRKRLAVWIGAGILVGGALLAAVAYYYMQTAQHKSLLARGRALYEKNCASCHGLRLEGQPNWQRRLPNGRMPAPPHDDTGHTWHHADRALFALTKYGVVPPYAPPGYQSDMPAFQSVLSDDEIRAVLEYIKNHWSAEVMQWRAEALRNLEQP